MIILSQWLLICLWMFLFWVLYLWKKNPGIIDLAWSLAIMLCGIRFLSSTPFYAAQWTFLFLLVIWALRLSGYLFVTRILPAHIDSRYTALSEGWKISKSLGFLLNYQLQGILAVIIAVPFLFVRELDRMELFSYLGFMMVLVGLFGETIADWQLHNFKKQRSGEVCNVGLWYYSRHPNYFFEWLIWVGFALAGLSASYGWLGFISPVLLLVIMLTITGPMTERQSLAKRGKAFLTYQKNTSMFFPLPPKTE